MGNDKIQLFEDKRIRTVWNEEQEEWYFSIVDVVAVLTGSIDPKQYIKKMRTRDPMLNNNWGTICTPVQMIASDGKKRKIQAANIESILRLIQSITSPKAEPFKAWLARVGAERIEETIDPELMIDRALATYLQKGYTREWINQHLQAIQVRKELTDEWQDRGITQGKEYAILTNEITQAWSGMNTQVYKKLKGLKKQNLRDNMSTTEIILNMLAETSTTDISKEEKSTTFYENKKVAHRGGRVAGIARQALEAETGKPVITVKNAVDFARLIDEVVKEVEHSKEDNENEKSIK
ncbi:MAG: BRO family protein [Erysipelotrichaceae bacterium]